MTSTALKITFPYIAKSCFLKCPKYWFQTPLTATPKHKYEKQSNGHGEMGQTCRKVHFLSPVACWHPFLIWALENLVKGKPIYYLIKKIKKT